MPLTPEECDLLSSGKLSAIDLLWSGNDRPLEDRLELICFDLRENYSKHNRRVEDYLSVVPELVSLEDHLIRIIVEEFTTRLNAGDSPTKQEYIERFPQFESIFEKLLVQEQLRATTSLPTQANDPQVILASRYKLVGEPVGSGAFGSVYLGLDLKLNRPVAVKLPKIDSTEVKPSNYLDEARMLAKFQHPSIVSIYDVGSTDEGQVYIVSQFVRGGTLKSELGQYRGDYRRIAETLASVGEALQFAHDRKIIHRDIKPANVLIDKSTKEPLLADFGLAITEEDLNFTSGAAGTPAYMSPEQIRGEGHRLDGRTDIFSLGVVLYELLTGELPFQGSQSEMLKKILQDDPTPPSSHDPSVPLELERICLKALSKQPSDRYAKASTMAQELRSWDAVKSIATEEDADKKITPKGLRSFDEKDAGYFLSLLPGPRNREGLPESIAFWKEKIEQRDPDKTFTVGLIYGPSGCGKSSLVKAGLIPNLSQELVVIYVEATAEDTEGRLLRQLRKRVPDLSEDQGFAETLSKLRRSKGRKVVLIIDQFEQWLYSHTISSEGEFERGLRQCDGARIQTVLMIRDDFYLAAARLMNQIDVPIVTDENFRLVDLFDKEHAKKVLTRFGQAYDKLPSQSESISQQQTNFVQGVIEGLSEGDKVVSVRIALIADMLKNREWVPSTLEALGGLDGIGVEFLEETFASSRADVRHRTHQVAVRGILKALLPDLGTQIKGGMRSEEELKEASGYRQRPTDFTEVVRVLDRELRLITPTDPSGDSRLEESQTQETGQRYYQLTHDYLVPSLRQWLTRKQRETKKGRAELKLAERAVTWGANQENKQLPTLWEWMQIRRWTDKTNWNKTEAQLMAKSNRFHGTRLGLFSSAVALLIAFAIGAKSWIDRREVDRAQDSLVAVLQSAEMQRLPDELNKVSKLRPGIDAKLEKAIEATSDDTEDRLKLYLALLGSSPKAIDYVASKLPDSEAKQVPVLVSALEPYADHLKDKYWSIAEERNAKSLLPIASALALWDPTSDRWTGVSSSIVDQLVKENPLRVGIWIETLRPAKAHLLATLQQMVLNQRGSVSPSEKDLALDMLESYVEDFETLHELIVLGEPKVFAKFFPRYQKFQKRALEKLQQELAVKVPEFEPANETDPSRLVAIERQANAAVALLRLEDPKPVYEFLTVERDHESLSQFIYRIRGREVSPSLLVKSFKELRALPVPDDASKRQQHLNRLYGMILGLGEYSLDQLPSAERDDLLKTLAAMYAAHPSRTIHSAVGWLLRRWGQDESVRAIEEKELAYDATGVREWYVIQVEPPVDSNGLTKAPNNQEEGSIDLTAPVYFTMLVYPGGEFEMGDAGQQKRTSVPGPFAVSDREVTWRQFSAVDDDTHRKSWEKHFQQQIGGRGLHPDEPVFGVNWFEAVNYCRWLTESKMPGEKNQCYAKRDLSESEDKDKGWLSFPSNTDGAWEWPLNPKRGGFRLLTGAEWEYVARGGTETRYSFGTSESLLTEYGWFLDNSSKWSHRTRQLRPNVAGVFDIHGNLFEWVDDWYTRGSSRVDRGGGWNDDAADCQSAYFSRNDPSLRALNLGFRLALSSESGIPKSPEADSK